MKMTGGRALAEQLAIEGIDTVFGVPGFQLDPALDALYAMQDRVHFIQTRHEQGAAYLADGYARASGGVGTFMVVPGPGMLNATAALSTAYACSSPVLAIIGQIPSQRIGEGRGMLHEIREQSQIIATLTKWSAIAYQLEQIPGMVHEAFRQLRSGRPRPVAIEIPPDVLSAAGDVDLIETAAVAEPLAPEVDAVAAAALLLEAARRPVICAGWGVQAAGGEAALETLAEALHAPVVASLTGRGGLSGDHPLAFNYTARGDLLAEADVVLAVGTRFLDGRGEPVQIRHDARLITINADEHDLTMPAPAVAVHADARLAMEELNIRIAGDNRESWSDAAFATVRKRDERRLAYLQPQLSWISAIREAVPADGVLVNELTQVGYVAQLCYPTLVSRTFLTPGYQGTLGYGFATALGAKVALPDRAVVSITGDGGFGWNLQELSTARKYGISLVTVIFRDDQFGNVRSIQQEQYGGRLIGTDLCNPDFVKLAQAFGVRGVSATSPGQLAAEIRDAIASGEPTVIDVPVGVMPSPWHLIHDWWPVQPPAMSDGD
jgi:acetolactate synthase I/II/III large subunit